MKRTFLTLFFMALAGSALAAEEGGFKPANTELGDRASLQRGAKLFMNYCLSCHSAGYMRYARMAEDLGLSEAEVQKNLNFTANKFGEPMTVAMSAEQGEKFFGKAPPDLSVTVRTKEAGPDWIYNYLKSFYLDSKRPSGWNNTVLVNAAMPNVLWELQGTQAAVFEAKPRGSDGKERNCPSEGTEVEGKCLVKFEPLSKGVLSPAEFDEAARDLTAFVQYVGEPAALERHAVGPWVILFLALFTFIAWLLKHEYWKDVH
jgi:ubiquinol-cytochrome c reductase cytochrome c1 subunit